MLEKIIYQMLEKGERIVLATIIGHSGSTPRTAGTKMLILQDGKTVGTIGGGIVEAEVIKAAPGIFQRENAIIRMFDLNIRAADTMDMICGGSLEILMELLVPNISNKDIFQSVAAELQKGKQSIMAVELPGQINEGQIRRCLITEDGAIYGELSLDSGIIKTLKNQISEYRSPVVLNIENRRFLVEPCHISGTVFIFGAGHVSQQLAKLTRMIDFRTIVIDDRHEFANRDRFADADEIRVVSFDNCFSDLMIDAKSYIVIVTRGHAHDKIVLSQALRTSARYIGMIGSHKKRNAIYDALKNEGFTQEDLNRVHSPIGIEIGAQTPQEIAVSIAAELIQRRARNDEYCIACKESS